MKRVQPQIIVLSLAEYFNLGRQSCRTAAEESNFGRNPFHLALLDLVLEVSDQAFINWNLAFIDRLQSAKEASSEGRARNCH